MGDMEEAIRKYYRGELVEAEKILKRILRNKPDDIHALVRYAAVQADLGHMEEAGAVYLKLAEIHEKEGSYGECLEFLDKASFFHPPAKISPLKGRCLFHLGRYIEALCHFMVSPEEHRNLFYTGKIYAALNQHENALRTFRHILSNTADTEEMFRASYWIGKSLFALGEIEEAISCFTSYLSFYPGEVQVYMDLALCCLNSGRFEDAKKHLLQYQNSGGEPDIANFYTGIVDYHLGNYLEAIRRLDRVSHHQALHWKGLAHYELGQYED
ncbi:MAG: tetratricopeptide repeat protein, partial [Firmicutes bacterium]|nr:tetratricopeptide repeat protein [Bacillota bacterium]